MTDRNNHPGFAFSVSCDVRLSVKNLWPDGNAPEHPSVADVVALIQKDGGLRHILRAWDLDQEMELTITGPGGVEVVTP